MAAAVGALPTLATARGGPLVSVPTRLRWRGADLSFLPLIESQNGVFRENGIARDCVAIIRNQGCNLVRLRLWVNPLGGWCNLAQTIAMAQRARANNIRVLLDLHYSDTWADPGQQNKPASWVGLNDAALATQVQTYTRDILVAMRDAGAAPEAVQLGNEVTDGMLWPTGRISSGGWSGFVNLLSAARRGVDDAFGVAQRPKVVIHIDRGADLGGATWFFDNLANRGVAWDVIGLSYYPWWHGTLEQCRATLHGLASRYRKPVFIAETAYPWTLGWNDNTNNILGLPSQLLAGFAATPSGQAAFVRALTDIVHATPYGLGQGVCWWAPDWIGGGSGSSWENLAWFDFTGNVLPVALAMSSMPA